MVGFEISNAQARPSVSLLLTANPDVEPSATNSQLLSHVYLDASCHDDNGLNLNISHPQLNVFLYKSYCDNGISSQQ